MHPQRITFTCSLCGTAFAVKPSRAARGEVWFCSRACSDKGRPHPRKPLADRFWAKVQKGDGCWLWDASRSKRGYGHIGRGGKHAPVARAHVVAWELTHGPVPDGLEVCHECDTPACVRPDHLFLGTHQENMDDMKRKGRDNRIGRRTIR